MEEYSVFTWASIIVICSFIGFVIENVWIGIRYGYFDNRNMYLPFLLGDGIAVVLFYSILGLPEKYPDIKYFSSVFVLVSLGEIILGYVVEKVCGIYYWDYSGLPFHLTRYTSLFTSAGFAAMITVFMRSVFPFIVKMLSLIEAFPFRYAGVIFAGLLIVDYFASFYQMRKRKDFHLRWKVELRIKSEDESVICH